METEPTFKSLTYKNNSLAARITISPIPIPKSEEILIKVKSAALNPVDILLYTLSSKYLTSSSPKGIGRDYAGQIAAVGSQVSQETDFKVGDYVCGMYTVPFGPGTISEYICLNPYKHKSITHFDPAKVPFNEACAWPLVFGTAFHCIAKHVVLDSESRVLIIGGNTSVGSIGIQLLKRHYGIASENIAAVCSTKSYDYVKAIGAGIIIDYTKVDIAQECVNKSLTFDLIVDCVGSNVFFPVIDKVLKNKESVYVSVVGDYHLKYSEASIFSVLAAYLKPVFRLLYGKIFTPSFKYVIEAVVPSKDWTNLGAKLVADGKVTPKVGKVFPLDEYGDAIELLASGKADGKIVVEIEK